MGTLASMVPAVDTFLPDTFAALRDAAAGWLPPGRSAGQDELVGALRAAEAATAGVERDLWGHAAATAAAAALTDAGTARPLWAAALDYARRASDAGVRG